VAVDLSIFYCFNSYGSADPIPSSFVIPLPPSVVIPTGGRNLLFAGSVSAARDNRFLNGCAVSE
jgi:hypothetical protein